jgi:hypothetical protein
VTTLTSFLLYNNTSDTTKFHSTIMSATILYKFRSGTTFEALPLPGSAAKVLEVKKAIVAAKKLDQGAGTTMEFDLSLRDAITNQEYADESLILPRGTRLIVQRMPAAKGHGFLSRLARSQYHGGQAPGGATAAATGGGASSQFYTIDSRAHDDGDELVRSNDDHELAALRAATDQAAHVGRTSTGGGRGGGMRPTMPGRGAMRPPQAGAPPAPRNADPELREQERLAQPKKRATGIPRTFLSLTTGGTGEGGDGDGPLLQPNTLGFEELVHRGGGQSGSTGGTKRDLEYALKVTATTVPEYLQCAICGGVVKDAMILPWDPEGRTTCESCIRDALTQNGFRCPLTGMEGVSPDDLLPNHALRKAADQFVKGVMEKMEEIDKQQVEDEVPAMDEVMGDGKGMLFEGDAGEQGVIVSRRATAADRKKKDETDPFGGDDDFGGDVFAVESQKVEEHVPTAIKTEDVAVEKTSLNDIKEEPKQEEPSAQEAIPMKLETLDKPAENKEPEKEKYSQETSSPPDKDKTSHRAASPPPHEKNVRDMPRREPPPRRRGPPAGYTMGPAGGATAAVAGPRDFSPRGGGGGGRFQDGRGRGGRNFRGGYGRGGPDDTHGRGGGFRDDEYNRKPWESHQVEYPEQPDDRVSAKLESAVRSIWSIQTKAVSIEYKSDPFSVWTAFYLREDAVWNDLAIRRLVTLYSKSLAAHLHVVLVS